MHRRLLQNKSDEETNVYEVTFSITKNGVSTPLSIKDSEDNDLAIFMISNKKADEKPGNNTTEDQTLRFQTMGKHLNDDKTGPEEGYENEIYLVESGGRGRFFHVGENARWFDGCMGLCSFLEDENPVKINKQNSRDILAQVRGLYDKYEEQLTGEKFLLVSNSYVPSTKERVAELLRMITRIK